MKTYYESSSDEVEIALSAARCGLAILVLGPTGCGKTRFVEHVAGVLRGGEVSSNGRVNVVTVTCHDDLASWDLTGRYLIEDGGTRWIDGPLTSAVREGIPCYLDEVTEARRDTTVLLHSLTDYRRRLFIDRTGELLEAPDGFVLFASHNPGLHSAQKRLKESTRQRFVPIELSYANPDLESRIIRHESGIEAAVATQLVEFGTEHRRMTLDRGSEPLSTRGLVHMGKLVVRGVAPARAASAVALPLAEDDVALRSALRELVPFVFGVPRGGE
ncbi:AAA family ATPase [Actinophytocola sp.]|uniref:AAA family ATPase n=1 Tax=Actinophytocola sp. TaxID=1872138 RepID=UPI003D6ADB57